jgi:hypothetical protein
MGKRCCVCKLDLSEGHFYKNARSYDGLASICKECKRSYTRARNFPPIENPNRQKHCRACGQDKSSTLDFFSPDKRNPDGMTYTCKNCSNERSKRQATHKENCTCCHNNRAVAVRLADRQPLCNVCRKKQNPEMCCICQKLKPVSVRSSEGLAICSWCYQKEDVEKCVDCGKMRVPNLRLADGSPRCSECQRRHSPLGLFKVYIRSAKKRKLQFELTIEYFSGLLSKKCFYCNEHNAIEGRLLGLDRVDNNQGYIKENVVPCCWICNMMKNKLGKEKFLSHVDKIARHHHLV